MGEAAQNDGASLCGQTRRASQACNLFQTHSSRGPFLGVTNPMSGDGRRPCFARGVPAFCFSSIEAAGLRQAAAANDLPGSPRSPPARKRSSSPSTLLCTSSLRGSATALAGQSVGGRTRACGSVRRSARKCRRMWARSHALGRFQQYWPGHRSGAEAYAYAIAPTRAPYWRSSG